MENKKEEIINRRDFFKKSVQKTLPILGMVVLGSNVLTSCMKTKTEPINDGSSSGCSGCQGTCKGSSTGSGSSNSCAGTCKGSCKGCTGGCESSCKNTCKNTCKGKNKY